MEMGPGARRWDVRSLQGNTLSLSLSLSLSLYLSLSPSLSLSLSLSIALTNHIPNHVALTELPMHGSAAFRAALRLLPGHGAYGNPG